MSETGNTTEPRRGRSNAARLSSLMKRATSFVEQGLYDEAIASIREAIALNPRNPKYSVELANIYRAQNRIGPAIEAMQQAFELDPMDSCLQELLLQTLLDMERYEDLILTSQKLLTRSPKSLLARDMLGIAYVQQGRLDKALKVTEELIRLSPTDPSNYFKKAVLFQQKGDIAGAMPLFIRVIEMAPESELADDAREMVAALDSYQLRQVLTIAIEDAVFKTKLVLDPESALLERGFRLSHSGIMALRNIDLNTLPGEPQSVYYH